MEKLRKVRYTEPVRAVREENGGYSSLVECDPCEGEQCSKCEVYLRHVFNERAAVEVLDGYIQKRQIGNVAIPYDPERHGDLKTTKVSSVIFKKYQGSLVHQTTNALGEPITIHYNQRIGHNVKDFKAVLDHSSFIQDFVQEQHSANTANETNAVNSTQSIVNGDTSFSTDVAGMEQDSTNVNAFLSHSEAPRGVWDYGLNFPGFHVNTANETNAVNSTQTIIDENEWVSTDFYEQEQNTRQDAFSEHATHVASNFYTRLSGGSSSNVVSQLCGSQGFWGNERLNLSAGFTVDHGEPVITSNNGTTNDDSFYPEFVNLGAMDDGNEVVIPDQEVSSDVAFRMYP